MQHSNIYTFKFVGVITIIVSLLLSFADTQYKGKYLFNIEIDKKKNILECLGVNIQSYSTADIVIEYDKRIQELVISLNGDIIPNLFPDDLTIEENRLNGEINYYEEIEGKKIEFLPLYYSDKPEAYILPISGKGLWSTLFGYFALDSDLTTVKGISFYKHKETAGLGGEIEKKWFRNNFIGKRIFDNFNDLVGIQVIKGKVKDSVPEAKWDHAVDGISGATITSKGVTALVKRELNRYQYFINKKINNVKYIK